MPYEYNPLLKDCFQKKSNVTPADITRVESEISDLQTTTTDLKQKKVTKFFSANDFLEDNEIAQYQGEDDSENNLTNGFFYKKNPPFTITQNSDSFAYNVNRKLKIYNFDGTFFEQYYLGEKNIGTSDYIIRGLLDESIFIVCFNPALFVNPSLPATPDGNMIFYPYLNVNGAWDYTNPVSVQGSNYYYKGNRINIVPVYAGLIGAEVGADMTSPYIRYLWVSILLSNYRAVFAFPYATNSNNELIALGVSNGLGAFGFQSHLIKSSIASTTINVQGVDIIANPPFTQTNTQPALIWSAYDSNDSEPRFINLDSLTALENIKFSYTPSNDYYITYDNLIARQGKPDIRYLDYCIINSLGAIYTHGQFLLANKSVDDYQYNGSVYGVQWDTEDTSPECTRIGNLSLHATLPVHNQIVGGLLTDDGTFSPFSNQTDWTTETRDGSLGQVMVKIPEFWFKFITEGTINKVLFSAVPVLGFKKSPEMFISAYEAALDRVNLKLSSVVNNSVNFRGGNNTAAWDNTYRELLGRPVCNINLTNFRTYARNRHTVAGIPDTRWNCMTYEAQRLLYWLFVVEFATLNTQKPFDAELTGEGFKQGGLGNGVSMWTDNAWNRFNAYNPFVPCGYTDEFGNTTNIKTYNVIDVDNNILYAAEVPRYRGIENPFAHIWQWTDGILVEVSAKGNSAVFIQTDCDKFSSVDYSEYEYIGNQVRSDNFIKEIIFGSNGDIIANQFAGNSATYYCDFYYGSQLPSSDISVRGCYFGGRAAYGARCGLVCGYTYNAPDSALASIGSRLCFKA